MKPYSEVSRFELNAPTGSFYDTGSPASVGETPGTFTDPLRNKSQIRITLPIRNPVKMLANSSSIYYFNRAKSQWNIPLNAVRDHVGPFDKFSIPTASWNPPSGSVGIQKTLGSMFPEDAKGFDAYSRVVSSGSLPIYRQQGTPNTACQTIDILGGLSSTTAQMIPYMSTEHLASVQRASIYAASPDEIFSVDLDAPFLLEKAVFEIPMMMGPTWFSDKTVTTASEITGTYNSTSPITPYQDIYIDRGGPALTLALYCQKNYGTSSIRDLIMTGTITHDQDYKQAAFGDPRRPDTRSAWRMSIIEMLGLKDAAVTVSMGENNCYTGSVVVPAAAAVSNGFSQAGFIVTKIVGTKTYVPPSGGEHYTPEDFLVKFAQRYSSPTISKTDLGLDKPNESGFVVTGIDPFGRGMTGFAPSGGSIFGGEYVTPPADDVFPNHLYIEDPVQRSIALTTLSSTINNLIALGGYSPPYPADVIASTVHLVDAPSFISNRKSPYLLRPGDRLVLALSKTRPASSASYHNVPSPVAADIGSGSMYRWIPRVGSTDGHDVVLNSGSIRMTFYGSYVKEGKNYIP
jgi:hypothetical protein